ncbi:MAG: hypothetical protein A2381_08660 [Bdellovibrionales bacterium RIFOXYB1_FULL_37_110]|nr:MAG: hypothetical protein A2181_08855 [Bdellovibrionales bacterium RIFOXYA1_FULL_38_20]OFZ51231.1 MAG: hypothetical protein A2417_17500 [Bdellovibrionales bacterium RIFOXYC1_FULL_37_79]OFZ60913.1 MAG: hypothetical protein A2381_08660 [Bdellovibrionales bacterium RIFOXYB1_FULL_37_110]OFZ63657.1 MAG: hypothetical protein A2577_07780 [Bdellovibrionales bacterium RIFOXYD1_FULL_36_51]
MIPLRFLFIIIICCSFTPAAYALKPNAGDNPKLFLFSSDLPLSLFNQYYILRKHVVDVVLATQLYDLVFSKIPEYLARSKKPQFILKYKLRTDGPDSYRIEFFLIDADAVQIIKQDKHEKISLSELLYEFRLGLYEFILEKKLRPEEKETFQKASQNKIDSIHKQKLDKRPIPVQEKFSGQPDLTQPPTLQETKNLTSDPKKVHTLKTLSSTLSSSEIKSSLWKLLEDSDSDVPWNLQSTSLNNSQNNNKSHKTSPLNQTNVTNPFILGANIALKTDDELSQRLGSHQFHFAWKYVQRRLVITDLVRIENEFYSLIGFTTEWIYYNPLHISKLLFRNGIEIDKALKTRPIDMKGHFLFRSGVGYKLNSWFLPSLYYEQSDLHYANLNEYGKGIVANYHSLKWISFEPAILGNKTYLSLHFAKSIAGSKNGDPREKDGPDGYRYGWNVRYFFSNKLWRTRFWADGEYRKETFRRDNINNKLEINKQEYSARLGVYF